MNSVQGILLTQANNKNDASWKRRFLPLSFIKDESSVRN